MKKIGLTILTVLIIVACNKDKSKDGDIYGEMKKISWLEGAWENKSPDGILSEKWEKTNDSTFSGHAYFIKGKDTLHKEVISLKQRLGVVTYNPIVQGQNNNKAVTFKMTSSNETQIMFENPGHDYPKKIAYNKINNDSIVAEISGLQQGKASSEKYPMGRK